LRGVLRTFPTGLVRLDVCLRGFVERNRLRGFDLGCGASRALGRDRIQSFESQPSCVARFLPRLGEVDGVDWTETMPSILAVDLVAE
jgi:hypothetical protein